MPGTASYQEIPLGTKIIRNAAFGALRTLLVIPIPFLLTPYIIGRVGTQGLGVWAVFVAINNLALLADLGFLGTLTKHVSEHVTKQDEIQLNRTINTGIVMYLVLAVVCICAINFGSDIVISAFFRQAPLAWIQLQHALRWLSLALALNLLAFPFTSITTGLQRLDFTNLLSALNLILTAILVSLFLASGAGILGFAYALAIAAAINLILNVAVAKYLLPQFTFSRRFVRISDAKALSIFSLQMYVTQIAVAVHAHTEKFLLAYFSGLTAAGWYDVANDLAMKTRSVPSLLLSPLLPAAAELDARQDEAKQLQLYCRTHKYLAFLAVPIAALATLLAHRFVQLWLGPGFSATGYALTILTGVNLFNLACAPGGMILLGMGKLKPGLRSAVYGIVSNLLLSTVLIMAFGFKGAVYGTTVSLTSATAYFLFMFHRETGYQVSTFLKPYAKPVALAGFLALSIHYLVGADRLGWIGLIVTSAAFGLAYAIGLLLLRYFDAFDLQALEKIIPIPKLLRRIAVPAGTSRIKSGHSIPGQNQDFTR